MTVTPFDTPYDLSAEQKASFERDGFLHLPDVLSAEQVRDLQAWSKEVHDWPARPGQHMPYDEVRADGSTGLCRTENYANFHAGFDALFRGERLVGLLSELMRERAVLFKEKINYKEPGGSGGFDAHMDSTAYNHAGAVRHQTFLMAVDDMTPANGCLEVVPGSHKMTVPIAEDMCIAKAWEAAQTWRPVPMKAGDLLVFGSYLAHRSGPNNSPRPRAAIYATYNGASEGDKHDSYYAHRRRVWPPTKERVPGVDYSEGAMTYAFGSPMAGGKEMIENTIRSRASAGAGCKTDGEKEKIADEVLGVIEAQGDADYIGESISQLEHALQAAAQAQNEGADDATVVAALLHDIGQFIPHADAKDMMHAGGSLGKMSHEAVGEEYLRQLGFPAKVSELVGSHVVAKRYLTATRPEYLAALSGASQASLRFQGGPFSAEQVKEFERDPLFREKVQLRLWDDRAKEVGARVPGLRSYRPAILRVLA